ncbi:MAG: hypothetical protein KY468_19180, partial [Armatimonadetes bacterium]|nr:hypothetical protein [Armatimonadota bacterium]
VVLGSLAGTFYANRIASTEAKMIPELRIGEQGPGPLLPARSARWTPTHDPDGYTVTRNLPVTDSRISQFTDFPLLIPSYLPKGSRIDGVTIIWDPQTDKRVVQVSIGGKYNGILTERRIRRRRDDYPDGILIQSEAQPNGTIYRNLQSNVDGVGVSMAWNPALSDEEIIKSFQSLKPAPQK